MQSVWKTEFSQRTGLRVCLSALTVLPRVQRVSKDYRSCHESCSDELHGIARFLRRICDVERRSLLCVGELDGEQRAVSN